MVQPPMKRTSVGALSDQAQQCALSSLAATRHTARHLPASLLLCLTAISLAQCGCNVEMRGPKREPIEIREAPELGDRLRGTLVLADGELNRYNAFYRSRVLRITPLNHTGTHEHSLLSSPRTLTSLDSSASLAYAAEIERDETATRCSLRMHSLEDGREHEFASIALGGDRGLAMSMSHQSRLAAVAYSRAAVEDSVSGVLQVWNVESGQIVWELEGVTWELPQWSPNDSIVYCVRREALSNLPRNLQVQYLDEAWIEQQEVPVIYACELSSRSLRAIAIGENPVLSPSGDHLLVRRGARNTVINSQTGNVERDNVELPGMLGSSAIAWSPGEIVLYEGVRTIGTTGGQRDAGRWTADRRWSIKACEISTGRVCTIDPVFGPGVARYSEFCVK